MKFEFSAGGIVYKKEGEKIFVLVSQHSQHHGWVFPKGFIGDKEEFKGQTKEETALREVKEETGITGKILRAVNPITYWYQMEDTKHRKTVYYFIMEYFSGDTADHDWEMENVEWLPIEAVHDRLTYPSDKKVWEEAKEKIINIVKNS